MHYKTFEEASFKWNERKQRVNYENIFIILVIANKVTDKDIEDFNSIPYNNKILISNRYLPQKNIIYHEIFSKKGYMPGEILQYKKGLHIKRYMDDIDYVSFLNNEMI